MNPSVYSLGKACLDFAVSNRSVLSDAIHLQFMVKEFILTSHALRQRGITFATTLLRLYPDPVPLLRTSNTPHGISLELWGMLEPFAPTQPELVKTNNAINPGDDGDIEEDDGSGKDIEYESDEDENIGEVAGSNGDDRGDEDRFDDDDEGEEIEGDGHDADEEDDLESIDEIDEEEDDADLDDHEQDEEFDDDDDEDDEDEYGTDWDEDEDEYDDDDDELKSLNTSNPEGSVPFSPLTSQEINLASLPKSAADQAGDSSEYIAFDIT
jgi:hypothetical protein